MPLAASRRVYREAGDLPTSAATLTERDWQIAQLMSQLFNLGDINHDFSAYSRIVPVILQRLATCGITLPAFNQIYNQTGWTPNEVRLAFAYAIVTLCPGTALAQRVLGFWGAESVESLPALRAPDAPLSTATSTFQFEPPPDSGGGAVPWDKPKKTPVWPFVAGGVGILVVGGAIFLATRKKKKRRRR